MGLIEKTKAIDKRDKYKKSYGFETFLKLKSFYSV